MNQADGRTPTEWLDFFKEGPFNIAEACLKTKTNFAADLLSRSTKKIWNLNLR